MAALVEERRRLQRETGERQVDTHNPWEGMDVPERQEVTIDLMHQAEEHVSTVMRLCIFKACIIFCFRWMVWERYWMYVGFWCGGVAVGQIAIVMEWKLFAIIYIAYCLVNVGAGLYWGLELCGWHWYIWKKLMAVPLGRYPEGWENPNFWFHVRITEDGHFGLIRFFGGLLMVVVYCFILEPGYHLLAIYSCVRYLRARMIDRAVDKGQRRPAP
mmetsp:Transcript_69247/g.129281  ORF Transcript_69247/g.129281 Transcript_69247/m.129281 type:complete len:215 (-) Transcript_69247:74-718(-)